MRVLIADDNKEIRSALTLVLNELWPHCEVAEAGHSADVPATVEGWQPDLVLLDWDLDGGPVGHIIDHIKSHYPASAVVAMSGRPEGRRSRCSRARRRSSAPVTLPSGCSSCWCGSAVLDRPPPGR